MTDAPARLSIERLGHHGDGISTDGVFVPRTLPGEVVEGMVEGKRVVGTARIVTPSSRRVSAPCPHYRNCGGCALQHADDAFVAEWKEQIVRGALAAQGLEAPFLPMHVSEPRTRRRATLAGRRLKSGPVVGFHARASNTVVAIPQCHLLHPDLMACLPALEEITTLAASRRGELALSVTRSLAGVDLAVSGGGAAPPPGLRAQLAALAQRHGLARLSWDGEVLAQIASPEQQFGPARVVPPPGAFLQATESGEAALLESIRRAIGDALPETARIADLFAGCGTFTLPLAEQAEIRAYEGDGAMVAALDAGWRHALGLKLVRAHQRDLFRRPLEPLELANFNAVVIDPPRAGAEAQCQRLAASDVPVIAYVSCNPVSFARDMSTLADGGYGLEWVRVVDQFRWSPHVELAACIQRRHMRG